MCPRTKIQFEVMREVRRSRILEAAIECFANSGYHSVTISELAVHAGISKGLLYNYFTSKEELLKAILQEILKLMMQLFDPDQTGDLERKDLVHYLETLVTHLKSNLIQWKMYMAIFSQPAVQLILAEEIKAYSGPPLGMVEAYFRNKGCLRPDVEMAFLSTLISGVIFEYISDPENYPLDQIKDRIIQMY